MPSDEHSDQPRTPAPDSTAPAAHGSTRTGSTSTGDRPGLLSRLLRSRAVLLGLVTAVILALAGTTLGYASMSKQVTLSLDGRSSEVTALAATVGDVLEDQGVDLGPHDRVAPAVDEPVEDGTAISVRFGRKLLLTVDGDREAYWVTSTDVSSALGEIGRRFTGAELSTSRDAGIGRDGLALKIVTPKQVRVALAGRQPVRREVTALTAREALRQLGVEVGRRDEVTPRASHELQDGDRIVWTKIRVVTTRVAREAIGHSTVQREDATLREGRTETVRAGRDGVRDVTYRKTFRNGELVSTRVVRSEVLRDPVDTVVAIGTKPKPEPEPEPAPASATPNFASGGTVWDQLAQCEAGGNWAINTGNGYYGGLQFSLGTWHSYGGAGYPHQQSREYQIMIAERVRAATGGYGSWPACSQALGLPQ